MGLKILLYLCLTISLLHLHSCDSLTEDILAQTLLQKLANKNIGILGDIKENLKIASATSHGCELYRKLGQDHTMCKYYKKACIGKTLIKSGGISCDDKLQIVNLHNEMRQNVSLGRVPGQPWAQNMVQMVWDDELAIIAQRWADQCKFGHDVNPNVERFMVGQNVYLHSVSHNQSNTESYFEHAIRRWFNEYLNFPGTVDPYIYEPTAGHYTQVAWGPSHTIGCGFSMYNGTEDGLHWSNKFYVCNYGVHGNKLDGTMYKDGRPNCNKFQNLSNSTTYPGLCVMKSLKPATLGTRCLAENRVKPKPVPLPLGAKEIHKVA